MDFLFSSHKKIRQVIQAGVLQLQINVTVMKLCFLISFSVGNCLVLCCFFGSEDQH